MANNACTPSIKNYRKTYWVPQHVPLDRGAFALGGFLAFCNIGTRAGNPRKEAVVANAYAPAIDIWATAWNGVQADPDSGRGRGNRIEPVPHHETAGCAATSLLINLSREAPAHRDSSTLHIAEAGARIARSNGAQG